MTSSAPAPPSPSASFYDLSDDEEGEYNTIRHTSSGKGVKLLYTKSKVYVHPSPSSKDNIPGFVALVQQKSNRTVNDARPTSSSSARSVNASSLLLAWIPESNLGDAYDTYVKVDLSDSSSPPRQSYLVPPPPTPSTHAGTPGYALLCLSARYTPSSYGHQASDGGSAVSLSTLGLETVSLPSSFTIASASLP